ncbi:MAG: HAD family hydrolase [Candidatus Woesearchaeota archaeon]
MICFDLDNTLCNYGSAEAEAEAHIASILSKEVHKREIDILRAFTLVKNKYLHHDINPDNFSRALWVEEALKNIGVKIRFDSKKIEQEYWNYLTPRMKLFANTLSTLDKLKKRYKLACITDSDGNRGIKMSRIKYLGLEKYFDYIITTDDTCENKPSIKNWEYLLEISRTKGEECMMIGDHPDVDLFNAKKLGFTTVWTKEYLGSDIHFRYVDHEIRDIAELLEIVEKY